MKILFLTITIFLAQLAFSQEKLTTVILLRHAEKENDGGKNPELSEAGKNRAAGLVTLLSKTKINAIYSTAFKRTENTVKPLAKSKNLTINHYDGSKMAEIDEILARWSGGTVVICGHSNTTPAIVNHFIGKEEHAAFADSEYGNLIIVTLGEKGQAHVTWLTF